MKPLTPLEPGLPPPVAAANLPQGWPDERSRRQFEQAMAMPRVAGEVALALPLALPAVAFEVKGGSVRADTPQPQAQPQPHAQPQAQDQPQATGPTPPMHPMGIAPRGDELEPHESAQRMPRPRKTAAEETPPTEHVERDAPGVANPAGMLLPQVIALASTVMTPAPAAALPAMREITQQICEVDARPVRELHRTWQHTPPARSLPVEVTNKSANAPAERIATRIAQPHQLPAPAPIPAPVHAPAVMRAEFAQATAPLPRQSERPHETVRTVLNPQAAVFAMPAVPAVPANAPIGVVARPVADRQADPTQALVRRMPHAVRELPGVPTRVPNSQPATVTKVEVLVSAPVREPAPLTAPVPAAVPGNPLEAPALKVAPLAPAPVRQALAAEKPAAQAPVSQAPVIQVPVSQPSPALDAPALAVARAVAPAVAPVRAQQDPTPSPTRYESPPENLSKEDPLPALLVNPFAAPPISLPALQPTVETPQAFLQRELAHIERVLVDWSPRAEVVSWQAPPDILPGTMVTVRNEEAAAQVVVTFVCSAEVSRQLLNNAAREFARELARELGPSKRGRRVVVRVQSAGDRAPPLEAVSDSDEVSG